MPNHNLPKDAQEKLNSEKYLYREYYDKNKTMNDIAVQLGVTQPTVLSYMRKFNIPTRSLSAKRNIVPLPVVEIKTLQYSGFTTKEIATKTKLSYNKIYYRTVTKK